MPVGRSTTLWTTASFAGTLVANFLGGVLVSRVLGPHSKGEFFNILMWYNIMVWFFNFSFYQATVYTIKNEKEGDHADVVCTSVALSAFAGVLALLASVIFLIPYLDGFVPKWELYWLFSSIPLSTVFQVASGTLNANMMFGLTNLVRVLQPSALFASYAVLDLLDQFKIETALAAYTSFLYLFNFLVIGAAIKGHLTRGRFRKVLAREVTLYGLKAHGATISDVVSGNITPIVLSITMPLQNLGYFSTAQSVSSVVGIIPQAISTTLLARSAGLLSEEAHATFLTSWKTALIATTLLALVGSVSCPWVIPLTFGHAYVGAITPSVILFGVTILAGQANVLRTSLGARGLALIGSLSEGAALLVTMGSSLALTRVLGVAGAACSLMLGSVCRLTILLVAYAKKVHRLTVRSLVPQWADVLGTVCVLINLARRLKEKAVPYHA